MKICIAQTGSLKGKIQENIQNHLKIIEAANCLHADLIVFPELSISGYEPRLAKELAINIDNTIFNPFQRLSNKNNIVIGVGMPTNAVGGICISMLIFQPNKKRIVYSKQLLDADEVSYFVCGKDQVFLNIKGKKVALGICYETLQYEHFLYAKQHEADVYIASVAKSKQGVKKACLHFSKMAKKFSTPILMSNNIGYCDSFLSVGRSAVWDKNGDIIGQLDNKNTGFLVYDTQLDKVENT